MYGRSQIARYTLLPGILPRIHELYASGFYYTAFLIAALFANVKLLPRQHPYLDPRNYGRFGIRHAIAAAAQNLVFSWRHADQILVFFIILAGLFLLLMQIVLLVVAVLAQHPAYALGFAENIFDEPPPAQDISFILLDRVFGVTGIFFSCVSTAAACVDMNGDPVGNEPAQFPFPFHLAMHRLFQFYSYGIFLIGLIVILYFITTIVLETAESGEPFGQRYNHAWAPVRLILFFAILIPIDTNPQRDAEGLNGGQLMTLYVARQGSILATNAWRHFHESALGDAGGSSSYVTQQKDLIAVGRVPEVVELIQQIYVARTCAAAYHMGYGGEYNIQGYIVRPPPQPDIDPGINGPPLTPDSLPIDTDFEQAVEFSSLGNVLIRFGHLAEEDPANPGAIPEEYEKYTGNVKPLCGEVTLRISSIGQPGADVIQEAFYTMVQALWADEDFIEQGDCVVRRHTNFNVDPECEPYFTQDWADGVITEYQGDLQEAIDAGIEEQRAAGEFDVPEEILERGWAGAAILYNRIATMNGAVTSALLNPPQPSELPSLMEFAMNKNKAQNENVTRDGVFSQSMADATGRNVLLDVDFKDREILTAMNVAFDFWVAEGGGKPSNHDKPTGNIFHDFVNMVFGTSGIFNMRENTDVHPLAQLSALGKSMMDASIRNIGVGMAGSLGKGALGGLLDPFIGQVASTAGNFMMTAGMATISFGVVLYYVLPLMPFIYFMFAVSGWVKSIFEAFVAMPLWALGHLRIDGEGLSGPGASNGYFLLLEIFLRPIMTVMGLLASITIFAAAVNVLNQIFDLVVGNVGGFNYEFEAQEGEPDFDIGALSNIARGPVDEFFFTGMYVIVCYVIGLSSFKLIDAVPTKIMRWMGVGVSSFQEGLSDPAGELSSQVYRGTELTSGQITGATQGNLALILGGK